MKRPALSLLLGLLAGAPAAALAESSDWLTRMAQAVRMQNYEGVMVYARDGRMESMRIAHRYHNGREQERLQLLSGDAREIHRDNDVVTCILPKDRSVKLDRRSFRGLLPALTRATADEIDAYYEIQELGSTQFLGRNCRALAMVPRDGFRYGYRMWIDEQTSLPLKVELLGPDGEALEQLMFTQIAFPKTIDDAVFEPAVDARDYVWIRHRAPTQDAAPAAEGWVASGLPAGFRMVVREQQLMPGRQSPVEHMVFTDGLATVSAFMAPAGSSGKFMGLSRRGAMTAYARMVDEFHVTVVGEVPQATVELIARQLRYQPSGPSGPSEASAPPVTRPAVHSD